MMSVSRGEQEREHRRHAFCLMSITSTELWSCLRESEMEVVVGLTSAIDDGLMHDVAPGGAPNTYSSARAGR